ncbi:hypothetical protein ANCCAN_23251 [Ancylostoma caninum]|uniref:Integrase zinc-binding domain-containing protein n=1 Tax=Ancylostoma caninum TaxID=29170 RepID=A0A368FFR8_ANCCA|nr:hypothetical protein ANCCAN_23251 [Ancylostoma caninum]
MEHSINFADEQKGDSFLSLVWQIKTNQPLKPSTDEQTKLEASEMANKVSIKQDGCLYFHFVRNNNTTLLFLVPASLRQLLFNAHHCSALSGGHMSWKKTLSKILRKYYWPTIYSDIHKWCGKAVGPKAIEDFRESNRYQGLEQLREAKEPLPTMPLKEEATAEEKNTYVHGLVFDNDGTAPVLYRIKSLFGNGAKLESVFFEVPFPDRIDLQLITLDQFAINIKTEKRGLDITKLIVGDLIWVYSLAVTTKFASTKMQAPLSAATAAQLREYHCQMPEQIP